MRSIIKPQPTAQKVYRKQDSFVALRIQQAPTHLLERIETIRANLENLDLPPDHRVVIRKACEDWLGSESPHFLLHSYVLEEINRLDDSLIPRYLFYRYRYEVYPQAKILDQFPPCLQIEPTSVCNYRCGFCYQTDEDFTRKGEGHMGMMNLETFKKIVDQAVGQCEAVTLASRGEPLLHPQINEMLSYLSGKFLALKINTNASLLDERKCHALLGAGINTIVFSADAASEPSYSDFRVGGHLDRVLKNIELFNTIRDKQYHHIRTITRVSGVKVPGTPDIEEMEKFWGKLVDQVAFVEYNPWEKVYVHPMNQIQTPCSDLWRRMFVWWDGKVNPCDVDYKSTLCVGSVHSHSLSEIWRSSSYQKLREKHVENARSSQSPCNRCIVV